MQNDSCAAKQLTVVYRAVASLLPRPHNARTHSRQQIRQIAASIEVFGFLNPVLVDSKLTIVAGHGRVEAAKLLGLEEVPVIYLESLDTDQLRAFVLADNKLAERAGWDKNILAIEFQHLMTAVPDLDVTVTGFDIPEIDLVIQEANARADDCDDDFSIDEEQPVIARHGDIWKLGKHRILCGDSLEDASFTKLMKAHRADVVFVDPPYNLPIEGHVCGNGAIHHREFAMATGEMSEIEFITFLITGLRLLARHSRSGSVHFVCMDWRHAGELLGAGKQVYDALLNLCVWAKNNAGLGSFYRSQHELVFVFRNGSSAHRNNVQLGRYGRNRTNLWNYPGINTLSKQGEEGNLLALHPTVKPVALVADALLDCSARGNIVLDSFLGSGTTLIASERVGRVCYGIEIDPRYVDTAVRRWQNFSGDSAIHSDTGKSFDDLAAGR
jgi:DNA modification methylase